MKENRQKYYVPRNSYPTASYYPQKPLPATEALFEKLDVDTLFFIFYYQQGTYQQFDAWLLFGVRESL